MPFMHGSMPLRRTFFYLQQGKIDFRSEVAILALGFHRKPLEHQKGAREFVFWHWAQLQYLNPKVQLIKNADITITPYAQVFLNDGREVLFDLENKSREEIVDLLQGTLGKTETVKRREALEKIMKKNPATFGTHCDRQCMCEIQGQHPCTSLLQAPEHMKGKTRWNHNLI